MEPKLGPEPNDPMPDSLIHELDELPSDAARRQWQWIP